MAPVLRQKNVLLADGTTLLPVLVWDVAGDGSAGYAAAHSLLDAAGNEVVGQAVSSPAANTVLDRLKAINTSLATNHTDEAQLHTDIATLLHGDLATIAGKDFATQTTIAAVLAKLSADPATQTTLAAVLAKLSADPATQTTLAAIVASLAGTQFAGQNAAAPANSVLSGAEFNTTPATLTSGHVSPLQLDSAGNLLVNIKAGAGSGGTALADEAAFTEGTTSITPVGGVFKTSHTPLTTGQAGALALSAARHAMVDLSDGSGSPLSIDSGTGGLKIFVAGASNAPGRAVPGSSASVVQASQTYQDVAASATATVLGSTGAAGDWLDGILVIPETTGAGTVALLDNATSVNIFVAGTLTSLVPFFIPMGCLSKNGAWKITTGANVHVRAFGNFT